MRLLKLDNDYYAFPEGIEAIEEFIEFVNKSKNAFIKMTMYSEEHCVQPYFILEDTKTVYVNLSRVDFIEEVNCEVMPRLDYERRLRKVVCEKCHDCVNFDGNFDDLNGHYEQLRLDGHCWSYRKKGEDEEE